MNQTLERDSNSISLANFYENDCNEKYNYKPSYQRESVWSEEKQSFLIDSIMRNFPIPPIFLRQKIDDETGKTTFDVIDGKQRLTSIKRFINDEIPVSTEELPSDTDFEDKIAGLFFSDLDNNEDTKEFKKRFWRYSIPIEYIDTESDELIKHVFDRLNRNGEPLTGQELRNAQFNEKYFHQKIIEIAKETRWKEYLCNVDAIRMEDTEFISELLFEIGEGQTLQASQDSIDKLYEQYTKLPNDRVDELVSLFTEIFEYLENLDCMKYCLMGVSHFYSIWCFCHFCFDAKIDPSAVKDKIHLFFDSYRERKYDTDENIKAYKKAMSSNTKSRNQREYRLEALKNFCTN